MMKKFLNSRAFWLVVFGVLGLIYWKFNPVQFDDFFPKCPFLWLTGLKCPGCGSQRAVHFLLNLDFQQAFHFQPLMVLSLPYLIIIGWPPSS